MSIRDLMADICDALNENDKCALVVEDGVYYHPTKEVEVTIKLDLHFLAGYNKKALSAGKPDVCTDEPRYIAYVFFVSLKKYGYEVNNVTIKSTNYKEIGSKAA